MGYLQLANLPGFNKAIISLWFRIPQGAIDAAKLAGDVWDTAMQKDSTLHPPLYRIIPLVTFGAPYGTFTSKEAVDSETVHKTFYNKQLYTLNPSTCAVTPSGVVSSVVVDTIRRKPGNSYSLQSCYVGVRVASPSDNGQNNKLAFHIQYPDLANAQWVDWYSSYSSDAEKSVFNPSPIDAARCGLTLISVGGSSMYLCPPNPTFHETITLVDQSAVFMDWIWGKESIGDYSFGIDVDADVWHHLLLSFDFSGKISATGGTIAAGGLGTMTSGCKLWVALDDTNFDSNDLPALWAGGDPNKVVTPTANFVRTVSMKAAFPIPNPIESIEPGFSHVTSFYAGGGTPTYNYTPPGIPAGSLGLPATGDMVSSVYNCEMAEFQMWINETLDTSDEEIRRAFLDVKRDPLGQPVPVHGIIGWMPVDPRVAAETVGRPQDVQLTTAANWQRGKNTGSLSVPFAPTGKIVPYPDPIIPLGT